MTFYVKIYKHRVSEHRILKCSEWLTCLLSWAILCSVENWDSETPGAYAGGVLIKSWIVSSFYLAATIIGYFGLLDCTNDLKSSQNKTIKYIVQKVECLKKFVREHGPRLTLGEWVDWCSAFFDFVLDLAAAVLIHFMIFEYRELFDDFYRKRLVASAAFAYVTGFLWLVDLVLLVFEIRHKRRFGKGESGDECESEGASENADVESTKKTLPVVVSKQIVNPGFENLQTTD